MVFYANQSPEIEIEEDEIFYWVIMNHVFKVFSPFEVDDELDFPNKDELGGTILKFIGGGAAYFRIQREMPSDSEVESIYEICRFLKESLGEYVEACIMCEPDIEIRSIDLHDEEDIQVNFVSARLNDGDASLEILTKKLENKERFTVNDHILRITIPFMGRKDEKEFRFNYSRFLSLYSQNKKELPSAYMLTKDMLAAARVDFGIIV